LRRHWSLAYGYNVGRLAWEYQGLSSLFYSYDNAGNLLAYYYWIASGRSMQRPVRAL
jgi:hypothetical protein